MTDKELKRLNRAELLELLLAQTRENEQLQQRLEEAEAALADRQLRINNAGSIAQAALEINGVMQAAQAAAQQYVDNIVRMEAEIRQKYDDFMSKINDLSGN